MHRLLIAASSVALLAGCNVGTSTYGTGKSQESQLVSDLASVVSFKKKKPTPIDYSERAALVKPTATGDLPAPIEVDEASSAFPGGAETTAPGDKPRIVRRGEDDGLTAEDRKYMNWQGRNTKAYQEWTRKRVQKAKARKALAASETGGRRYFTEPPAGYRKAYDTAPTGDVGRSEQSKEFRKKSKGNIFSKLLGRG